MSESAVAQPSVEDKMKNEPVEDTGMDNEVQMGGVEAVPQEINEGVVSQKRNDSLPPTMSTAQQTLSSNPATPSRSSFSIPDLLSFNPGFGSRTSPRVVSPPSNRQVSSWRIGVNGHSEAFMRNSSFNWNPLSANSVLEMPMSAMGIGFGEAARTKHVKISVAHRASANTPRLARYVPPARRGSGGAVLSDVERRTSLNDSTHRRLITELLKDNKSGSPASPVEFPESTVIESGKLPSWEERRRIRLARGTAIATVKTVIMSPLTAKSDMASPGLTRSLVAIAREDREDVGSTIPQPVSSNSDATVITPAKALTSEIAVPRSDIILCKFYHTPGLKCTASPCRFVHEINRSPLNSPMDGSMKVKMSTGPNDGSGNNEDSTDAPVEIVEVFRMSGGGRGAGSEWAKAKFRTVPCRDFAAGYCSYGNFCSFVHETPKAETKPSDVKQDVKESSQNKDSVASTLALDLPSETDVALERDTTELLTVKPTLNVKEHVKGDPVIKKDSISLEDSGDSQRVAAALEIPAKEDVEIETMAPSTMRPSSVETVVLRKSNPSIMLGDRPLRNSIDLSLGTPPTIRPNKFKSTNIVVPDYRWSQDQGLVASPSATSLNFTIMSPGYKVEPRGVTSLIAPTGSGSVSPRTVVSPVQYADVPPPQAWQKPLPGPALNSLSPDDHAVCSGASSAAPDESPFLPITAYSFSTDSSSPPATPAGQRQEVVTPDNDLSELPPVDVYHEAVMNGVNSHVELWQQHQYHEQYAAGSSPVHGGLIDHTSMQPWMVDAYLQQMTQASSTDMWGNPLSSGYGLETSKFQFAKHLAKQAREGDLPPQVPQSKTNYRTKPCRFFVEGNCPHGDECSYSHDAKVIARAGRRSETSAHKLRTQPCKFFNSAEGCHVGNDCSFLHQYVVPIGVPMVAKPRPWRTKPCRHYAEGKCLAGDKCHFAHVGSVKIRDAKRPGLRKAQASGSDCTPDHSASGGEESQTSPVKARKSHSTGHKKKTLGNDDIQIIVT